MNNPISLEMEVPPPGQYCATVVSIRLFERGVRISAKIAYQLDSEPPFDVSEFVAVREEHNGTDILRGKARLRELAVAKGIERQSITSTSDLQQLAGARVEVTILLQEDDGIQMPKIVSVSALSAHNDVS